MAIKNAFSAFGLDASDATIDTLRTDLAYALKGYIERSGKGKTKVGEALGLKQSVVSHIVRGDIDHRVIVELLIEEFPDVLPGLATAMSCENQDCERENSLHP